MGPEEVDVELLFDDRQLLLRAMLLLKHSEPQKVVGTIFELPIPLSKKPRRPIDFNYVLYHPQHLNSLWTWFGRKMKSEKA